jgi:hypothetical protein
MFYYRNGAKLQVCSEDNIMRSFKFPRAEMAKQFVAIIKQQNIETRKGVDELIEENNKRLPPKKQIKEL